MKSQENPMQFDQKSEIQQTKKAPLWLSFILLFAVILATFLFGKNLAGGSSSDAMHFLTNTPRYTHIAFFFLYLLSLLLLYIFIRPRSLNIRLLFFFFFSLSLAVLFSYLIFLIKMSTASIPKMLSFASDILQQIGLLAHYFHLSLHIPVLVLFLASLLLLLSAWSILTTLYFQPKTLNWKVYLGLALSFLFGILPFILNHKLDYYFLPFVLFFGLLAVTLTLILTPEEGDEEKSDTLGPQLLTIMAAFTAIYFAGYTQFYLYLSKILDHTASSQFSPQKNVLSHLVALAYSDKIVTYLSLLGILILASLLIYSHKNAFFLTIKKHYIVTLVAIIPFISYFVMEYYLVHTFRHSSKSTYQQISMFSSPHFHPATNSNIRSRLLTDFYPPIIIDKNGKAYLRNKLLNIQTVVKKINYKTSHGNSLPHALAVHAQTPISRLLPFIDPLFKKINQQNINIYFYSAAPQLYIFSKKTLDLHPIIRWGLGDGISHIKLWYINSTSLQIYKKKARSQHHLAFFFRKKGISIQYNGKTLKNCSPKLQETSDSSLFITLLYKNKKADSNTLLTCYSHWLKIPNAGSIYLAFSKDSPYSFQRLLDLYAAMKEKEKYKSIYLIATPQ